MQLLSRLSGRSLKGWDRCGIVNRESLASYVFLAPRSQPNLDVKRSRFEQKGMWNVQIMLKKRKTEKSLLGARAGAGTQVLKEEDSADESEPVASSNLSEERGLQ